MDLKAMHINTLFAHIDFGESFNDNAIFLRLKALRMAAARMSLRATHQLTERLCGASLQWAGPASADKTGLVYQEFVSPTS